MKGAEKATVVVLFGIIWESSWKHWGNSRKPQVMIVMIVTAIHVRGMSGDKMVDIAGEIRPRHMPNTSRERYRVERLRNSTKNISVGVDLNSELLENEEEITPSQPRSSVSQHIRK